MQWLNITATVYSITVAFVKASILLQYLRIFVPSKRGTLPLCVAIHACMWSVVIFYVIITFFNIFMCTPRAKISNLLITTGHCFDTNAAYKSSGVFNVFSDFAILILPMPTLWNLQLSLKRRLWTMGLFAGGFL